MRNDLIARRPSIAAAAVTGLVWAVVVGLGRAIEAQDIRRAALLNRVATGLAIVIVAVPVGVAVAQSGRIERTVRSQWNAFVHLSDVGSSSPATTQTRLFSGAGNRYDYWRIAWHAFTANPLIGVGAGNYAEFYYRQRQTQESIENPHSLELQTLSELGLIGAILLALALGGVALGALRMRAVARSSPSARTMMVAALGATIAWLIDTSGDWMHLLPGVTGVAIIAVAVLCQGGRFDSGRAIPESPRDGGSVTGRRGIGTLLGAAVVAFVLAVGGASLLRAGLVRIYLDDARAELPHQPAQAINDASSAIRLDGADLDAYYVKAAGEARFDQAAASRATLIAAARADPEEFVTWTLLGDLEVRLRAFNAAKGFYARARALDPNDPSLASLAANPASALPATRQNGLHRASRRVRS